MKEVYDRIFIGSLEECFTHKDGWVVVHACKHPCHCNIVGYQGTLPKTHPYYLIYENENNLFLNIIDPHQPLFMMPLFTEFLKFTRKHWKENKNILIHCNQGNSRAPSLALLFLAKEIGTISNLSYEDAKKDFLQIYTTYSPGEGIQIYLTRNWNNIQ